MKKIKPQLLKGTRDFLPEDMVKRQYVVEKIRQVFERYGFDPLETPAIERWETLAGKYGEETERLIYRFQDRGGRDLGLRYDLTVPLARIVAMHPEIPKPFKRYQIQSVWRAEKPQRGRFREFVQCDVDIVGTSDMTADAEIISVVYDALSELGLRGFIIKINNRKVVRGMVNIANIPVELELEVARSIDKLDKIGLEGVKDELVKKGIGATAIDRLLEIIEIRGRDESTFKEATKIFGDSEDALQGLKEIEEVFRYLKSLGIPDENYILDLSLVRGLDYYTGPVFETVMETPRIGSIMGGGRYDNLIGMFTGTRVPATGTSIGLDRLITVMDELNLWHNQTPTKTEVLVTRFDKDLTDEYLKVAQELRKSGINTDFYTGKKDLRAQLGYASDRGIPIVLIIGTNELEKGLVTVKMLKTRTQESIQRDKIVEFLKNKLGK